MNRIEEIKHNFNVSKAGIAQFDECGMGDHVQAMHREYVDHVEYLLSKLEIAEKALEMLDGANALQEVNLDRLLSMAKVTTGTELMLHENNRISIERANKAKVAAKEALKAIRE